MKGMNDSHFYAEFIREYTFAEAEKFLQRVAFEFKAKINYHLSAQITLTPSDSRCSNHEIFGQIESSKGTTHFSLHRSERGEGFIGIGFGIGDSETNVSLAKYISEYLAEEREQTEYLKERLK